MRNAVCIKNQEIFNVIMAIAVLTRWGVYVGSFAVKLCVTLVAKGDKQTNKQTNKQTIIMGPKKKKRFQDGVGAAQGRGGRGRGRGRGEQRGLAGCVALFHRLLKGSSTEALRNNHQAMRFLQGMDSFDSKPELLSMMVDERNQGRLCLERIVGLVATPKDVTLLVIPLLQHALNDFMSKPLYREVRDQYLSLLYHIPHVLTFANGPNVMASLEPDSARVMASFLLCMVPAIAEARHSATVRELAQKLRDREDVGNQAQLLCAMLRLPRKQQQEVEPATGRPTKRRRLEANHDSSKPSICWYTDTIPPGGRHDNDLANFREIKIVPTAEELTCQVPPYLPLASGENAVIQDAPVDRFLDANFRLLREDSIGCMRRGIIERKSTWRNARIIDADPCGEHSFSFLLQVDPPSSPVADWDTARFLLKGSIVEFLDKDDHRLVRTGTVSIRRKEWLCTADGPLLGIEFEDPTAVVESFLELAKNSKFYDKDTKGLLKKNNQLAAESVANMTTYEMVEISKSFFANKSVLKALQQMEDIPFSEELLTARRSRGRKRVLDDTDAKDDKETAKAQIDYMRPELAFPEDHNFHGHKFDLDKLSAADISTHTSLDESQAEAVVHALTHRVALIQGPPGTGMYYCTKG